MPNAGGGSVARRGTDGWCNLRDCPCSCKPVGKERKSYLDEFRLSECRIPVQGSHGATIIAQPLRSIDNGKNLIGRDVISKFVLWRKCAPSGNFAHAETFPLRHAGEVARRGLFHDNKQETDKCASRRLLR